jgi:hypothetical protein
MKISGIVAAAAATLPSLYIASGVLAAVVVTECALRAIGDVASLFSTQDKATTQWNLSANLGGILFYGGCALNLVPATRLIGAAVFVGYSFYHNHTGWDEYLASKVIRVPVTKAANAVGDLLKFMWKYQHPTWYGAALIATAIWFKYGNDLPAILNDLKPKF